MASPKSDSPSAIAALKQQWRQRLKKICQELSIERRAQASAQACQGLSKSCQAIRFVLSFASFGSEINLWPLNQELAKEGRLVLPYVTEENLLLFQVAHLSHLQPHRWGMLEPKISICPPVDPSLIEIALIPGLGFDLKTKYRLGYGKGYYDRLLASASSMQIWGVGFVEQAVENLPYSKEDIPLHQILLF
jgi:5-formyltetrahydrofolate cyclo-ligase